MSDTYIEYEDILGRFLEGTISAEEFQRAFLGQFKNENRHLNDQLFELLDGLFSDVDAFTTDPELVAENPRFYLDEAMLREKTSHALKQLIQLQQENNLKE